jgi:hypothetical protein
MAHHPLNLTVSGVHEEVLYAWTNSYSPEATARAIQSIANVPVPYKISHLVSRLFFRGIYFPQKGAWRWLWLIAQNRRTVFRIIRESFTQRHGSAKSERHPDFDTASLSAPVRVRNDTQRLSRSVASGADSAFALPAKNGIGGVAPKGGTVEDSFRKSRQDLA